MTDDAQAGVGGEDAFQAARCRGRAIRHDYLPGVLRVADAHAAAVVETHPRRAAHRVDERVEDRPVGDGV